MNVPAPKFLIEKTWEGRVFGAEWRAAAGGSLDVLEPATGNKITSVGNATAKDVRQAAAEARAAQPGWAATPYEERAAILRKAARILEDNQEELIPWIARETGGIPAKAGFEIHLVTEGLYRSAAMCTERKAWCSLPIRAASASPAAFRAVLSASFLRSTSP
jgi:benzaldehyde dehydrogenase (NAD)